MWRSLILLIPDRFSVRENVMYFLRSTLCETSLVCMTTEQINIAMYGI